MRDTSDRVLNTRHHTRKACDYSRRFYGFEKITKIKDYFLKETIAHDAQSDLDDFMSNNEGKSDYLIGMEFLELMACKVGKLESEEYLCEK
jgi:hypothetical protein